MKKNKATVLILILLMGLIPLYSQTVNRPELESVGADKDIKFVNYTGPHKIIDTLNQIRGIGISLGTDIIQSGQTGSANRYQVIHAVDDTDSNGLNADILILGSDVLVDHIKNLRLIIASYLKTAYNYSDSDANTLASFVTIYNAVYRGKIDVYSSKYKKIVVNHLQAEKVGLSINYTEWPGKTQIVIPLTGKDPGSLSAVDTTVISDKNVVANLQNEADKGIDQRKNLVDLKAREADEATNLAQEAAKKAAEADLAAQKAQEAAKTAQAEAAKATKAAEETAKIAEQAKQKAQAEPDNTQAQQEADKAAKAAEANAKTAEQAQKTAKAAAEEVKQTQTTAKEEATKAAQEQAFADKKTVEAIDDRTSIAKDQQKIVTEEDKKKPLVNEVFGLKVIDKSNLLSVIVAVNASNGQELRESPVNVIRGRSMIAVNNNFIAIAGKKGGNSDIKLVIIDGKNLDIIKQSKESVAEQAVLVAEGSNVYTVIQVSGGWTIAKFDQNLELLVKSPINVSPETALTLTADGLIAMDSAGKIKYLKKGDLTEIK